MRRLVDYLILWLKLALPLPPPSFPHCWQELGQVLAGCMILWGRQRKPRPSRRSKYGKSKGRKPMQKLSATRMRELHPLSTGSMTRNLLLRSYLKSVSMKQISEISSISLYWRASMTRSCSVPDYPQILLLMYMHAVRMTSFLKRYDQQMTSPLDSGHNLVLLTSSSQLQSLSLVHRPENCFIDHSSLFILQWVHLPWLNSFCVIWGIDK